MKTRLCKCFQLYLCFCVSIFHGCATTPTDSIEEVDRPNSSLVSTPVSRSFPTVDIEIGSTYLHQAARQLGEEVGGGVVVMDGISDVQCPDFKFKGDSYADVIEEIAEAAGQKWQQFPGYFFVYPEGYESLLGTSISSQLSSEFKSQSLAFSIGANTRMYNAMNLIGHSLGKTVIADNFVADARCGEISLQTLPLNEVLEAILMSARIPGEGIRVVSTPSYVFIGAKESRAGEDAVVAGGEVGYLERQVSLYLPSPVAPNQGITFYHEVGELSQLRENIAQQLGISVEIDDALKAFPINPCAMNGVSIRDALNLLVWQWPITGVRCLATAEGVRFELSK